MLILIIILNFINIMVLVGVELKMVGKGTNFHKRTHGPVLLLLILFLVNIDKMSSILYCIFPKFMVL